MKVEQRSLAFPVAVAPLARWARRDANALLLDGEAWGEGTLVAVDPRLVSETREQGSATPDWLPWLEQRIKARRRAGGTGDTGLAVLLGYDAMRPTLREERDDAGFPDVAILEVDCSVRLNGVIPPLLTCREVRGSAPDSQALASRIELGLGRCGETPGPEMRLTGPVGSSLPRERYLEAVRSVRRHIARGDIYQANLCQSFAAECAGDPLEWYLGLRRLVQAPHRAFLSTPSVALASASPETFLAAEPPDRVATFPIKGTRGRVQDPEADDRVAQGLLASPKDRAELLMIVDLERNDLGRVSRVGSVETLAVARLRTFPSVHHLEGHVRSRLRDPSAWADLLAATFPGGSITGAPKRRAMEILAEHEPVTRNFFTGSLCWFGDDGTLRSSILIRSVVFGPGRFHLGAGGGIVWDSDPEAEWHESNLKARALAGALGFEPEEAG